jgi:hypothetical protein
MRLRQEPFAATFYIWRRAARPTQRIHLHHAPGPGIHSPTTRRAVVAEVAAEITREKD